MSTRSEQLARLSSTLYNLSYSAYVETEIDRFVELLEPSMLTQVQVKPTWSRGGQLSR